MIAILTIFKWILSHLKVLLIATVILLSFAVFWLYKSNIALKTDNSRISENFIQKDKQVSMLTLTVSEFKELQGKDKDKIDSLLKVTKIKPKQLRQTTIINYVYQDTGSVKIIYKEANQLPDKSYSIQISVNDNCWGIKANILSTDKNSKLEIKERSANNDVQVLVTKKRKFLFWTIRKERIQVYNDCQGEVSVSQINFIK